MELERNGFIFYRSFYEALKDLENEQYAVVHKALCEYALNGKEPNLKGVEKSFFLLIKPTLDTCIKNYLNGCKPKAKRKPNESETQASIKPNESETQAYKDKDKDKDKDNKENSLTTIKEEKSSSDYLTVFLDLYQIQSDISSLTMVRNLNFKAVMQAYGRSKWLRDEIKSLRWVVNNYHKIIDGEYDDKPQLKTKTQSHGWTKG